MIHEDTRRAPPTQRPSAPAVLAKKAVTYSDPGAVSVSAYNIFASLLT
jgi:hypothetical protein